VTDRHTPAREYSTDPTPDRRAARQRYEPPRLVDYGAISKLTQAGGITIRDNGNMFQRAP
jgi:hypothetical protein